MNELSIEDANYIAAIIDGEGSISLGRTKDGKRWTPSVSVANNKIELMRFLTQATGVGNVIFRDRSDIPNSANSYQWQLRTSEMLPFLIQVLPYLRLKNQQALLLMAYLTARENKPAEWTKYRAWVRKSLLQLNRRGKAVA